ncbi:uncharacterized protein LOC118199118 [Stegodyphus dumicola]|uniref:uncharacterized protein LOC118199118 n=1 Tax=Stegodyphus dumicola TaxID=202533 RepID=UPI0015B25E33|nr:uncharacterized protein LOC118199118 [Stegodyphus dumicola]
MWENYVKSRGVTDFEGLNQLVVADKIYQTLDTETAVHIGIRQGDSWFKPRELGKECDIFFAAKGKSYNVRREACETKILNQAVGEKPKVEERRGSRHTSETIGNVKGLTCFGCGSASHFKRHCPQIKGSRQYNRNEEKDKARVNWVKKDQDNDNLEDKVVVARVDPLRKSGDVNDYKLCELKRVPISVNGTIGKALVDSGTEITVVKKELTKSLQLKEGSSIYLKGIFGPAVKCPLVSIPLSITVGESANVTHQEILCAVAESLAEDVLLPPEVFTMLGGRLYDTGEGVENLPEETTNIPEVRRKEKSVKVNTGKLEGNASMGRNLNEKGKVESSESQEPQPGRLCTADVFRREQETCESLVGAWENAQKGKGNYYTVDNFLFHKDKILGESVGQLVVPKSRREEVLQLAHCSVFSGHMGVKKTVERIRYSFYWEGLRLDVQKFCEACKECQLTRPIKTVDRTPITPVTRPDLPFQIVNIDVIGPIDPPSSKGHKYILCLVDQHTRWAEAIPLTSLSAKSTCEELLHIFSRTGIPNVIACDNGTNFKADLTQEFERRIGASPKFSTPGYPQANGLVERFNGTLKRMLHHVIREEGRGWHLQIPYVLWAYREVPNSTTGVAPFQLMYGRTPQGPLSILKSSWTGKHENLQLDATPVYTYLQNLKARFEKAAEQAKLTAKIQQERTAHYHNLRSTIKTFKVGDKVIVLIPDSNNKLYARWQGPANILEQRSSHSFVVQMPDGTKRHVHQNKIRPYVVRSQAVNVILEGEEEFGEIESIPVNKGEKSFSESLEGLEMSNLDSVQRSKLLGLLRKYQTLFTRPVQPARVGTHTRSNLFLLLLGRNPTAMEYPWHTAKQ